jgi:hypothetical protein
VPVAGNSRKSRRTQPTVRRGDWFSRQPFQNTTK